MSNGSVYFDLLVHVWHIINESAVIVYDRFLGLVMQFGGVCQKAGAFPTCHFTTKLVCDGMFINPNCPGANTFDSTLI